MQIAKAIKKPVTRPRKEGQLVTMSNALARAGTTLTLSEKRIVMLAISKISHKGIWNGSNAPIVDITAREFAETFNVDLSNAYDQLKEAAVNLYKRSIHYCRPIEGSKHPVIGVTRWVSGIEYHKNQGWARLQFTPQVSPHLLMLNKQYTQYTLAQATALRSIYSWKLLELLMKFEATGVADYSIEDFCTSMQATDGQRANFGQLNLRVIKPAIKELTEKDGWLIHLELTKLGRKVTRLRFAFSRTQQRTIFEENATT